MVVRREEKKEKGRRRKRSYRGGGGQPRTHGKERERELNYVEKFGYDWLLKKKGKKRKKRNGKRIR